MEEADKLKDERGVYPSEGAMLPAANGTVDSTNANQEKAGGDVEMYRCFGGRIGQSIMKQYISHKEYLSSPGQLYYFAALIQIDVRTT